LTVAATFLISNAVATPEVVEAAAEAVEAAATVVAQ
jgi:hypothetical protein